MNPEDLSSLSGALPPGGRKGGRGMSPRGCGPGCVQGTGCSGSLQGGVAGVLGGLARNQLITRPLCPPFPFSSATNSLVLVSLSYGHTPCAVSGQGWPPAPLLVKRYPPLKQCLCLQGLPGLLIKVTDACSDCWDSSLGEWGLRVTHRLPCLRKSCVVPKAFRWVGDKLDTKVLNYRHRVPLPA